MVNLRRFLPVACWSLGALAAVSCSCLDFKGGTLTVRTDCLGGPEDKLLAFGIFPAIDELSGEVKQAVEQVPVVQCDIPETTGLECVSVGAGIAETGEVAMMCGTIMHVAGPVDATSNVFFLCEAPQPFGEETLWPMKCRYVTATLAAAEFGGRTECQAIADLEILAESPI